VAWTARRKVRRDPLEKEPDLTVVSPDPPFVHQPPPSPWQTKGPRIVAHGFGVDGPFGLCLEIVRGEPMGRPAARATSDHLQTTLQEPASPKPNEQRSAEQNQNAPPMEAGGRVRALTASPPQIRILGPVEVTWREEPDRRIVTELACFLAMHAHRSVTSEEARAALWPGDPGSTEASAKNLRNAVSLLRRALGAEHVPEASKGRGYRLSPSVTSDWTAFERLVAAANAEEGDAELRLLAGALTLVRGAPFQGVKPGTFSWAWTELIVARIEAEVATAAHRLSELCLASGHNSQASWAALRGLVCSPYDRSLWRDLLIASSRSGRGELENSWRQARAVLGSDSSEFQPLIEQLRFDRLK
jgi:DNA-binding SARP family transcriptional activator